MEKNVEDARNVLSQVRDDLLSKPNVVATGIGYKTTEGKKTGDLALICSVETKKAKHHLDADELIPESIQNIPTDVYPTGVIHALQDPTGRFRPAPGGVSIGHYLITAGTLGCYVKKNDSFHILSNNHVLANSNNVSLGDSILQPGPHDGGINPQDKIAELSEFVPIDFEGDDADNCPLGILIARILNILAAVTGSKTRLKTSRLKASQNLVDCAIAKPLNEEDVLNEILNIGKISDVTEGVLGMNIKKSGRTTGFTTGTIQQVDVTSRVSYGSNKTALFVDQLMAGAMSAGGDSGSAVLSDDNKLTGLLFAGSSNSTVINRIQNVFDALQVTLT